MSLKLNDATVPSGTANSTRRIDVPAENIDAFVANLEQQFPALKQSEAPAYASLYASMRDPKGNVTVWQAKKGMHTVTLTGACTALKEE
jgi:hypothetical protein